MRNFVNRIIQIIHFYLLGPLFVFCHILGPFCMTCIYKQGYLNLEQTVGDYLTNCAQGFLSAT